MRRAGVVFSVILVSLAIVAMTGWGALAFERLSLSCSPSLAWQCCCFTFCSVESVQSSSSRARWRAAFYWHTIEPRQDRDWAPEYTRLAYATVHGDQVTVHNIRNFDYRTETDFTPGYYTKNFDLSKLDSVDIIASYWAGDAIAHIIVSFGFAAADFLAVSIETRRERNESYSSIAGFFKQYELFYVVADGAICCACEQTTGTIRRRTFICIESVPAVAAMPVAFFSTISEK